MLKTRMLGTMWFLCFVLFAGAPQSRAAGCEDTIAHHMVGEAMLAAQFVAAAERNGMTTTGINGILKDIADKSGIQEFWITDPSGHAYLTNTGIDFTFSSDPAKQPQASAFWPLITGSKKVVIQNARKREIDSKIFKYVGVEGVDKPRIVQVGVGAGNLCK
jgi:adenylate cyclase